MIAVDSSALIAIARKEQEARRFMELVALDDCIVGAPTHFEAAMVLRANDTAMVFTAFARMFGMRNVSIVAFDVAHARAADAAFQRFGKGQGHPAQLNFGDCMSYAIAQVAAVPLLFKGNDFSKTDIVPAWQP